LDADSDPVLPLSKGLKNVLLVGPHASAQAELVGNYLGEICPGNSFDCVISPAQAVAAKLQDAGGKGCELTKNSTSSSFADAIAAAKYADAIVLAMGIGQSIEGESHDRTDVALPLVQHQLIAAIRAAYPHTPTVMFLLNGGMVDITIEKDTVPAIVECFYPGFWGGQAIADTLFGDNLHLGGRMPFTTYPEDYINKVKMTDMSMTPSTQSGSPGRSYRYYTGTPTFPFGYGLALTTFALSDATEAGAHRGKTVMICGDPAASKEYKVTVKNTGSVTGDTVVLAFFKPKSIAEAPFLGPMIRQLYGFERVHLTPGESTTVSFVVVPRTVQMADTTSGDIAVSRGVYELEFTDGVDQHVRHQVQMEGSSVVVQRFPRY